jgi:hypothetical protein
MNLSVENPISAMKLCCLAAIAIFRIDAVPMLAQVGGAAATAAIRLPLSGRQSCGVGAGTAEASHKAIAQLSAQVDLQATVLAFKNAFWVLCFIVLLLVPLPFVMRRPSLEEAAAAAEAH